ncbi:MAG: hypothetical protein IIA55_06535 [Gemmatimonadetes bacterium]|nr:hypothetical protein [Gemmatimonadota bacterium]
MVGVLIAVFAGVLLWLVLAPIGRRQTAGRPIDEETLDAEQEVRDLDAFTTPEDADDELTDWGPGVPYKR